MRLSTVQRIYCTLIAIPLALFPIVGLLLAFFSLGTIGQPGQWKFPVFMAALSIASIVTAALVMMPKPPLWAIGAGTFILIYLKFFF